MNCSVFILECAITVSYTHLNLNLAKIYMRKFKQEVLDNPAPERLVYPQ